MHNVLQETNEPVRTRIEQTLLAESTISTTSQESAVTTPKRKVLKLLTGLSKM